MLDNNYVFAYNECVNNDYLIISKIMESHLETILRLKGKYLKGTIQDWAIVPYGDREVVVGDLYPINGGDKTDIRTSFILEFHKEYSIIETKNSVYKLGQSHPYNKKKEIK